MLIPAGKAVDLVKLKAEAIAAGVALPRGLGRVGLELHTYDAQGVIVEPPAGMTAVLAAHDGTPPAPPNYGSDAPDIADNATVVQWVADTRAFLALSPPTQAQTLAQVQRNARALLAIVRRLT